MKQRIFGAIISVALVTVTICVVLSVVVLQTSFDDRSQQELTRDAEFVHQGMYRTGTEYLALLPEDTRATLVEADGTVRFDNWEDPAGMENHADRPEIRDALENGCGWSSRRSETLGKNVICYALRLSDGSVLRLTKVKDSVWSLTAQIMRPLLLAMLLACVLSAVIAYRSSRSITQPINAIDPAHPELAKRMDIYEEIEPLIHRIQSQNRQIALQMEQLRQKQEEFTAIMENMEEGFLVLDAGARILSHNASALRLLDAEGAAVDQDTDVYSLNREPGFRICVEEVLAGRRSERILEKNERCRRVIANPVQQEGRLDGAVIVILDVTESERREGLQREFTANVSHELKTPLTAILGTAEILKNGLVQAQDVTHFAGNIHREAARLIELVNDIIHLSRLDEGSVLEERAEVDLYETAEDVLEQVRTLADSRGITLQLQGRPVRLRTIAPILEEIIYNLCENAVKYNREGGSVTVEVREAYDGARLTVEDTGVGISPEQRERVFERFYRADRSRSTTGTGLGLSIVKRGAAYLGARVELFSEKDVGSRFVVTFPKERA